MAFNIDYTPGDLSTVYNPVAGLSGTTSMKFVLRQIVNHWGTLTGFPFKEIISGDNTVPLFLQSYASNIPVNLTQADTSTGNNYIYMYWKNDPGLNLSTPQCHVLRLTYNSATEKTLAWFQVANVVSGQAAPTFELTYSSPGSTTNSHLYYNGANATTTDLTQFYKIITAWDSRGFGVWGYDGVSYTLGSSFIYMPDIVGYDTTGIMGRERAYCFIQLSGDSHFCMKTPAGLRSSRINNAYLNRQLEHFPISGTSGGQILGSKVRFYTSNLTTVSISTDYIPDAIVVEDAHHPVICGTLLSLNNIRYLAAGTCGTDSNYRMLLKIV